MNKKEIQKELKFLEAEKEMLKQEKIKFDAQREDYEQAQEVELLEQMYNDECMSCYDEVDDE